MVTSKKELIKLQATNDLESLIRLISPKRVLGSIHCELARWWQREDRKSHQLTLLPRDHQKSAILAYRCVQKIIQKPDVKILYISSTSALAVKQLKFIKDILTSDIFRFYWPEMVNLEESKREKWTETEISIDHPRRKEEGIREPTIFTAGLTTSITGLHCDVAALDDLVVRENAYSDETREKVKEQYSLLASIEGTDAEEWVVGTRYDPNDLYETLIQKEIETFDENGEPGEPEKLFEVFERTVEDSQGRTGNGQFLWPRQRRHDGVWYGFDAKILAKKKAQYLDLSQFYAQYYNDPNSIETGGIERDCFQYYDRKHLSRDNGRWCYKGRKLNVFAAVDFAYSLSKRADYTCVVVVGVDGDHNYYVLDIERFKTDRISEYYNAILRLHLRWDFRKIRAEISVAQRAIVTALKQDYIKRDGLALAVEDFNPSSREGSKEERTQAALQARYANRQIWHYQGGHCQTLEEELILRYPPHDDIKDCLASCVDFAKPPARDSISHDATLDKSLYNPRFGGIL